MSRVELYSRWLALDTILPFSPCVFAVPRRFFSTVPRLFFLLFYPLFSFPLGMPLAPNKNCSCMCPLQALHPLVRAPSTTVHSNPSTTIVSIGILFTSPCRKTFGWSRCEYKEILLGSCRVRIVHDQTPREAYSKSCSGYHLCLLRSVWIKLEHCLGTPFETTIKLREESFQSAPRLVK